MREESKRSGDKTSSAVVIAGGGPTGLMLAGELALAGVDVVLVERRENQELAGMRAGGLHARAIEVLDQRGIAERFLSQGRTAQLASLPEIPLDISDFPTRHNYWLALTQNRIEQILADWVAELAVPILRGREVTGFAQDESGVDVELSDGSSLRARYLVGCDGGRSRIRPAFVALLPRKPENERRRVIERHADRELEPLRHGRLSRARFRRGPHELRCARSGSAEYHQRQRRERNETKREHAARRS